MYKDAHIFLQRKKKNKRRITTFPQPFHFFFHPHACTYASPCWMCIKMHTFFFQGKRKSQRRALLFRRFCFFFSVPKYAHVLFAEEREEPKESGCGGVQMPVFSPSLPLLFPFRPLYLHMTAQPFSSARFLFSEGKGKSKEGGCVRV